MRSGSSRTNPLVDEDASVLVLATVNEARFAPDSAKTHGRDV